MPGFKSLRNRLIFFYLLIITVVMVTVSLVLYNMLERYYLNHREQSLIHDGERFAMFLEGYLVSETDPVRMSDLAEWASGQTGARIIILDYEMTVVGDSNRLEGFLGKPLDRPEIRAALEGKTNRSVQFSEQSQQWIMQVALPIGGMEDEPLGALFLSSSLQDIYDTLGQISSFLFFATVAAILAVGGASVLLARRVTRPLNLLTRASQQMAQGHLEQKIEIKGRDEIARLARQFNNMASKVDYMTRNLKSFAGNVSHELRTPLTTMSLLIKSLKEHELDQDQQKEFLDDLDKESERLINLVNSLLELTRLEHFKSKAEGKNYSIRDLLMDMIEQMAPAFSRAGLEFSYDVPQELPLLSGSPVQIRQALYNLIDNALKYTEPGGKVNIAAWVEPDRIGVKIQDTGKGIPPEARIFIFERFYRSEPARDRNRGGAGLGLSIAKEIIHAHGGSIWVESMEGKGSTFYVTLPIEEEHPPELVNDN